MNKWIAYLVNQLLSAGHCVKWDERELGTTIVKMNTVTLPLFKKFCTSMEENTFKKCSRQIDEISNGKESEFSKVDQGRGETAVWNRE